MSLLSISPIDGRYINITSPLNQYFSEWALMKYRTRIEIEWLISMSKSKWLPEVRELKSGEPELLRKIYNNFKDLSVVRIKEIEKKTNHDVKAVEYYLREELSNTSLADLIEFLHFGCTSEDINNLSYALMLKDGLNGVWLPKAEELVGIVSDAAFEYRDIPMLSHTHGQPATPTTAGKELAIFVHRWKRQLSQLNSQQYLGKFNGAVGNFNAHKAAYPDAPWEQVAEEFVNGIGLAYNSLTTQIESHDYMAECFDNIARFNNITLDFDRDMWLYISMEYFRQQAVAGEVGSSTMPHKVNPINFENAEANSGMSSAILRHLADKLQISRLQRDLSDSSAQRNIGAGIAHSLISIHYSIIGFKKLSANKEKMENDLSESWEVLAEAVQTVMRRCGFENPYETLKKLTRNKNINREDITAFINGLDIPDEHKKRLLELTPAKYTGIASRLVDNIR